MAEVFADGEPVDPQKLRNLQSQINEIRATAGNAYNLISTTVSGNTVNRTFHHRSGFIVMKNLASGKVTGPVSCGFTWDSSKYEEPVTVVTPILESPGTDTWSFSVSGTFEPKIYAYYKDSASKPAAFPSITINWVSSARYKLE
jgi:hypothetical protein